MGTRDSITLVADAEKLVGQLRSNADAHRECAGTERRRAADVIEELLALANLRLERALDAAWMGEVT